MDIQGITVGFVAGGRNLSVLQSVQADLGPAFSSVATRGFLLGSKAVGVKLTTHYTSTLLYAFMVCIGTTVPGLVCS
jgi:hypothetical protein